MPYTRTPDGWRLPPELKEEFLSDILSIKIGWADAYQKYMGRIGAPENAPQAEVSLPPLPWFIFDRESGKVFALAETVEGGLTMVRWDAKDDDWGDWVGCGLWKFWEGGRHLEEKEARQMIGDVPVEFLKRVRLP